MKNFSDEQEQLLTAYALGELDKPTRLQVERELLSHDEARRFVEETRKLGDSLAAELRIELGDGLDAKEKQTIEKELTKDKPKILSFPTWARYATLAAAACVAVLIGANHFLDLPHYGSDKDDSAPEMIKMKIEGETPMEKPAASTPQTAMGADGLPIPKDALSETLPPVYDRSVAASQVSKNEVEVARKESSGKFKNSLPDNTITGEVYDAKAPEDTSAPSAPASSSTVIMAGATSPQPMVKTRSRLLSKDQISKSLPSRYPTLNAQGEGYDAIKETAFADPRVEPLSTFSIDVDTASYSNVRRFIMEGQLPPHDAVRIEEMVNYFTYNYPQPKDDKPFSVNVEVSQAPWNTEHYLARIGIKGKEVTVTERSRASLVFLIDVSGSMSDENKLPLVISSLKLLVNRLRADDRVAIVTYANGTNVALSSTPVSEKGKILSVLENLTAGGGTNGAGGIQLAYEIAKANFIKEGINRVILATDGDFNVGITDRNELLNLIKAEAKSGVFLNVYGFGMGNLKDDTLSLLSQNGNGIYGYIDTAREARRIFVEKLSGTLVTIAKDVKIQVEFNPAQVSSYKLIGYENRMLAARDFNDDKKDAGEIGAGHTVTALYEIVPAGQRPEIDPLKFQPARNADAKTEPKREAYPNTKDLMVVKLRYKKPDGDTSSKIEINVPAEYRKLKDASADFRLAAAVAGFGLRLRNTESAYNFAYSEILRLLENSESKEQIELRELVAQAATLTTPKDR